MRVACAAFALVCASGAVAAAQPWHAFTKIDDVCPRCSGGPQYDRVQLRGGEIIFARVLAENETFIVVEKFGEERALGRDQIQNIAKNGSVDRPQGYSDQILMVDGIVWTGTLAGDVTPDAKQYTLRVPNTPVHTIEHDRVAAIYRDGKRVFGK